VDRLLRLGLVVAGGMVGSLIRYIATRNPGEVPWSVVAVNVAGAAAAGWLVGRIRRHSHQARWLVPLAVIGVAGALTTFSGMVVDSLLLADGGRWGDAVAYASVSVVGGPVAAIAGLRLGDRS